MRSRYLALVLVLSAGTASADPDVLVAGSVSVSKVDTPSMYSGKTPIELIYGVSGTFVSPRFARRHVGARVELGLVGGTTENLDGSVIDRTAPGWQLEIAVPYYPWKAFDGPFVEVGLAYRAFTTAIFCGPDNAHPMYCDNDSHAIAARLSVGAQHTFANGLSVALVAGVGRTWTTWWEAVAGTPGSGGVSERDGFSTHFTSFSSELRVGYAF
jgi:hypothetical protein